MRSRSSVLSHIVGSSPHISGYSELSISYAKYSGLLKQKLVLSKDDAAFDKKAFLFDKILHNAFDFDGVRYLNGSRCKNLIMLRDPESTIRSIVTMGRKNGNPKYSNVEWAVHYYTERVTKLVEIGSQLNEFFFIESDRIVDDTEALLHELSGFIGLPSALSSEYRQFSRTGQRRSGDTSVHIHAGRVVRTTTNEHLTLPKGALASARMVHRQAINRLSRAACNGNLQTVAV
ncbi:sulfotransferase family protein [Alteromonas aestuariivivens]|uniref:sulfotransferase family protein n=1 Tax=Alteromonas aestuariivivens TaxID=1938339 RepID=UPI0015F26893|nr:sulfotransferase family protein [Alteromonas aestuariivivens]